ncbi:MAG: D-Ala-D-Ala carboxypeptidase family metallohydrolase [Crocinitomicaceae bacterium]
MKSIHKIIPILFLGFWSCESPESKYDRETGQTEILTKDEVDAVLDGLEKIDYTDLPASYINYSDPYGDFEANLKSYEYFVIKGDEVLKFVVGKTRIQDFMASDGYKSENAADFEANKTQYWLVDRKMIYMIVEFIDQLDEKGLNKYGFYVRESHRHPKLNKARGGASKSQHIYGKAADLVIEDINNDGKANQKDKEIALEILEGIVGSKGGMGLYPGTMTIHIDCRGYAARWDSY